MNKPVVFIDENLVICRGAPRNSPEAREFGHLLKEEISKAFPEAEVVYSGQCESDEDSEYCDVADLPTMTFHRAPHPGESLKDILKRCELYVERAAPSKKDEAKVWSDCLKKAEPTPGAPIGKDKIPPRSSSDYDIYMWLNRIQWDYARPVIVLSNDADKELEPRYLGDRIVIDSQGQCYDPKGLARTIINRLRSLSDVISPSE